MEILAFVRMCDNTGVDAVQVRWAEWPPPPAQKFLVYHCVKMEYSIVQSCVVGTL